jgi:DNA-binding transcriptional LysR family regulator
MTCMSSPDSSKSKLARFSSIRSFRTAQGVTPQAASQALAQLEQHPGVRLLHRTTRSLALTEEGQRFLENTQPALAALDRALTLARESKDEIAGPLRSVDGSRAGQPKRVRTFLDLALSRLHNCRDYVLADKELAQFGSRSKRSSRVR